MKTGPKPRVCDQDRRRDLGHAVCRLGAGSGRAATLAELSDGDTLLIGDTFARYEATSPAATAPNRRSRTPSDPATTQGGCFALLLASASLLGVLIGTAKTLW